MKKKVLEFPLGTYKGDIKSNLPHGKGGSPLQNQILDNIILSPFCIISAFPIRIPIPIILFNNE